MLDRVGDRVHGQAHAFLHKRAARNFPRLMDELMTDALARWAGNNWARFDEHEVNCTGQLYRWLRDARRSNVRFGVLDVRIENVILTPGMMNGTEPATHAARPDLRISVHGRGVFIEAKRLTDTGDWARKYVYDGMARFVSSAYAAEENVGMMVGYVQQPATDGLRARVNAYVANHQLMGPGNELSEHLARRHAVHLESAHTRAAGPPIQLNHLWVTLP